MELWGYWVLRQNMTGSVFANQLIWYPGVTEYFVNQAAAASRIGSHVTPGAVVNKLIMLIMKFLSF